MINKTKSMSPLDYDEDGEKQTHKSSGNNNKISHKKAHFIEEIHDSDEDERVEFENFKRIRASTKAGQSKK